MISKCFKNYSLAERSFDLRTSGLWAQHASTAPLCYLVRGRERRGRGLLAPDATKGRKKQVFGRPLELGQPTKNGHVLYLIHYQKAICPVSNIYRKIFSPVGMNPIDQNQYLPAGTTVEIGQLASVSSYFETWYCK